MKFENNLAFKNSKNMLKDIESIDNSPLWAIENGASVVKTGEKFKGADVYRVTFQTNKNGRVYQLFNQSGLFSASLWVKFIQYDTSLLLILREKNFGTSFGLTTINNVIYDWQQIKLENANVTKECMFGLYKSGLSQSKEVIVDIAMPQLEKGVTVTDFEPFNEINKKFKGTPKKNLLPDWNDKGWFQDSTVAGGVVEVDPANPHKMKFVMNQPAQARLIHIPVEAGKAYTFSFGEMTGVYRLYKGKVTAHGGTVLVQDSTPKPFTFVVDGAFNGFVTLRVTQGWSGTFWFNNLQLEEGYANTTFEPYKEMNRKGQLTPTKNYLLPFTQWKAQETANVNILELTDRKLSFELNPTGSYMGVSMPIDWSILKQLQGKTVTFSVKKFNRNGYGAQIQLRFYGGAGGNTEFVLYSDGSSVTKTVPADVTQAFVRVQTNQVGYGKLDVEELQLEVGDKQTEYSPFKLSNKKQTTLTSKKNLIPPFYRWNKAPSFTIDSDYKITGSFVSGTIKSCDLIVDVTVGKTYTLSGLITPANGRIRIGKKSDNSLIGVVLNGNKVTFMATEPQYYISIDNNFGSPVYGGTLTFENVQLEEGEVATEFTPYKEVAVNSPLTNRVPYRNYPFSFERASTEILDGVQYRLNQPRFKDNGLLIEAGTVNMVRNKGFLINSASTTQVDLGDRLRLTATNTSNFAGAYITSTAVKANTTYTLSARFNEADQTKGKLTFVIEQAGNATMRLKPTKYRDRYYLTFTTSAGVSAITTCFYLGNGVAGDVFELYKDVQLEEKPFPTTYTSDERKMEKVFVPSALANTLLDTTKGSLEMKFTLDDIEMSKIQGFFLFDSNADRVFSNYDSSIGCIQVSFNKLGVIRMDTSEILKENTLLVEWDGTNLKSTLNGKTGSRTSSQALNNIMGQMSIGSRYSLDMGFLNYGVVKSFVIKDRNGNTTYRI